MTAMATTLELLRLLDKGGQAAQDGVQNASHLAGRDQVHEEVVEDLRVFLERLRQGGPSLHVPVDLFQQGLEGGVLGLLGQDLQTLHQRKPCVDHGGELTGENHEVFFGHFRFEEGYIFKNVLGLRLQFLDGEIAFPEVGHGDLVVGRIDLTLELPAFLRDSGPLVDRHLISSSGILPEQEKSPDRAPGAGSIQDVTRYSREMRRLCQAPRKRGTVWA
jgi:hypothetical protein